MKKGRLIINDLGYVSQNEKKEKSSKKKMNRTAKKILKYGGIVLFGIIIFVCYEIFIRDLIVEHSKERVQKSSKLNFHTNKENFNDFKIYIKHLELKSGTRLEFFRENEIGGSLGNYRMNDSIDSDLSTIYLSKNFNETRDDIEFELNQNGTAKIIYPDTTFKTHNWIWNFKLNNNDKNFRKLITYLGISEEELKSLRNKIEELDCEAILVNPDKSISIRYDGFFMYQYEYYFPSKMNKAPSAYKKLDEGIYSGIYDCGLYCGKPIIFEK